MKSASLTREDIELWLRLESEAGADGLLGFIPLLSPKFSAPTHLRPIADLLTRVEHEAVRACVSVPPRHAKTETLLHAIAWILLRHPDWTIAYCGHTTEFAESKSRRARDLAKSAGVQIRSDAYRLGEWRTVQGGGLLAVGIGGPLTGHGAHLIFIDDPHKNREEAESPLARQRTHEWFTSVATTRLEPGGSIIVVHTKWHADDLIGRLSQDKESHWNTINLPAINADGEALWPERFSKETLQGIRKEVGEYDWASLYLGQPRPKGGQLFHEPIFYTAPNLENARLVIACDPAATEKTTADYSAIVVLAARRQDAKTIMTDVVEVWRGQVEIPKLVQKLTLIQQKYNAPIVVEAVGGFKAVPQMLKQVNPNIRLLPLKLGGDKFTRALPAAAAWNEGLIRVPQQAPWLDDFLFEVTSFTGVKDKHDDQVDALAHAFSALSLSSLPRKRGVVAAPGNAYA